MGKQGDHDMNMENTKSNLPVSIKAYLGATGLQISGVNPPKL